MSFSHSRTLSCNLISFYIKSQCFVSKRAEDSAKMWIREERVVAHRRNAARVVNGGRDEELPLAIDDERATVEGHIASKR
jgi:hypothetical protein